MLFFAEILVFSNIFGFLAVNRAPKWIQWIESLAAFHSSQNSKFSRIFQTPCFPYWRLPMVEISARSNKIWGVRAQKIPKMGHFMDTESIRKTSNTSNFTTT